MPVMMPGRAIGRMKASVMRSLRHFSIGGDTCASNRDILVNVESRASWVQNFHVSPPISCAHWRGTRVVEV
jgi:hypothetical protein